MNMCLFSEKRFISTIGFSLALGLWLLGSTALHAQTTSTWWTGVADTSWDNAANWTAGVPGPSTQAVFTAANAERFSVDTSLYTIKDVHSLRFSSSTTNNSFAFSPRVTINFDAVGGTIVEVEAGGPAVTIDLGPVAGVRGSMRLVGGQTYYIVNHSDHPLKIVHSGGGIFYREMPKQTVTVCFDGSGVIDLSGCIRIERATGHVRGLRLEPSFTGTLLLTELNAGFLEVNGGTLLTDSNVLSTAGNVTVNAGTLTGNGRIARPSTMNTNSVLDPGRVGATGALTFEGENSVVFNGGATLRLDLLSALDHDQLLFETDGESLAPTVSLSTTEGGVTLNLNLLAGFTTRAGEAFTILSGYESLSGTFAGLPDRSVFKAGPNQTRFQIHYEEDRIVLAVLPSSTVILVK